MERNIFDGRNPVSVLSFLAGFKKVYDGESIPKAATLQIAPYFLDSHLHDVFEAMKDDAKPTSVASLPGHMRHSSSWKRTTQTPTSTDPSTISRA